MEIEVYTENSCNELQVTHPFPQRLTFGHIVNHREPKGTRFVLDAVHKLRMDGLDFAFLFGERLPHTTTMELYNKIDVMLEQYVIGFHGLAACEFALLGKPVVVWINEADRVHMPPGYWDALPWIQARGEELPQVIRQVCEMNRYELAEIGRKGREFVWKYHDHRVVADQIIREMGI